jgi:ABC-type branched-subunit amino acid transport system substrate-binding protein
MMKKILLLLILWGPYGTSISQAQRFGNSESKYKDAVASYRQGRYEAAMSKLAPLTSSQSNPSLTAYSHYYYALAAYQLKKYNEGYLMLRQLMTRFPAWNRQDDVHYLMGALQLAQGQYAKGLENLQQIESTAMEREVMGLKQQYLGQIRDLGTLKALQQQFPADKVVALSLVSLIQKTSTNKADLELSDRLTNRFAAEANTRAADAEKRKSIPRTERNWNKGYYNVAVMLPFRLDEFQSARRTRSNQFAYDYYQGMLLAQQQLRREGITVNLQSYDVSNEEDPMLELLNNVQFRQADLLIGPLYPKTYDLASGFATENDVLLVNPLSTDGTLLSKSDNAYLAHPSVDYQMKQAAQVASRLTPRLAAVIYYGATAKDSAMAVAYEEEIKSRGGKVIERVRITDRKEDMNIRMSRFETEKPTHVLLASTDPQSGPAMVSALNARGLSGVPLIATSTSFDFQRSRPQSYGGRLYLIETDYIDLYKESVRAFRKAYYDQTSTLPSVYAYQGYDQLLFLGRRLAKYKDRLADGLKSRLTEDDYLLSGFDFSNGRENQIMPILRHEGSRWVPVR